MSSSAVAERRPIKGTIMCWMKKAVPKVLGVSEGTRLKRVCCWSYAPALLDRWLLNMSCREGAQDSGCV